MRKLMLTAAVVLAAFAVIAATQTDPLTELKQLVEGLTTRVDDHETRLAYLERFAPIDTFETIEGAGSTAELATELNNRILFADGIEIAVTGAKVITKQSEIKLLPVQTRPPAGHKLVSVDINIYNTSRELGVLNIGSCPWETRDTLATGYAGRCDYVAFWNIAMGEDVYPIVGNAYPFADPSQWFNFGILALDATVSEDTLYFHVKTARPLEGLLTYSHPANEVSQRYWKLQRPKQPKSPKSGG